MSDVLPNGALVFSPRDLQLPCGEIIPAMTLGVICDDTADTAVCQVYYGQSYGYRSVPRDLLDVLDIPAADESREIVLFDLVGFLASECRRLQQIINDLSVPAPTRLYKNEGGSQN